MNLIKKSYEEWVTELFRGSPIYTNRATYYELYLLEILDEYNYPDTLARGIIVEF